MRLLATIPAAVLVLLPAAASVQAQKSPADSEWVRLFSDVAELAQATSEATARFVDQRVAITEGYHKVGPDFPGMGEHWVNFGRLLEGGIDPNRPPVLTYLPVGEKSVFTGVAFARVSLPRHETGEDELPESWHFHSGTIEEETLFLNPESMTHPHTSGPKLAMVHLWVGVENPEGVTNQDNWSLPFLRLGINPPAHASAKAGKALFLLTGGVGYYETLIRLLAEEDADDFRHVRDVLESSRSDVAVAVKDCLSGRPVEVSHVNRLEEVWDDVWSELQDRLTNSNWEKVRVLAG